MKRSTLPIVIGSLVMLAMAAVMTPYQYLHTFGGEFSVYARILLATDCAALEEEYGEAEKESQGNGHSSPRRKALQGYMTAIADRLERLGCQQTGRLETITKGQTGSSQPVNRSLAAYKAWIGALTTRFTTKQEIQLTEEEWVESWLEYWARFPG